MADKPKVKVHCNGEPVTLRLDEMVEGEMGIKTAKQVGEIALGRGENEVDSELWDRWLAANKENPLFTTGLISFIPAEPEKKGKSNGERSR